MSTPEALSYDVDLGLRARGSAPDVDAALALAVELSPTASLLGVDTHRYLSVLATLGRADLTTARTVEPHLDALTILEQAGRVDLGAVDAAESATWGVFAAHGPGHHLTATKGDDGWLLDGTKPWCSLADRVSHAVITAHVSETQRAAFAVAVRAPFVRGLDEPWVSRGLVGIRSTAIELTACPAVPVGDPGWYLERPGFAWGGIGVAAVWVGGARALVDALVRAAGQRTPDQVALAAIGAADERVHAAETCLAQAAQEIDSGRALGRRGQLLAARVRAVAAEAAQSVLTTTGRALGPGALTGDEEHARRVADLTVYIRQHHAERDHARLGELLVGAGPAQW